MRSVTAKLVIGMVIMAIGMFGADNSLGSWKFNASKSNSTSSNPTKSRTDLREATPDGGVKITRTEQSAQGAPFTYSFTFKYDGKPYPVTEAAYDTISMKRIDANTTSFEAKKNGGKYHVTGQTVISKDGKTMTQTAKGIDADGRAVSSTRVFDKQ